MLAVLPTLRLQWLDIAILLTYLVAVLGIGFRSARRHRTSSEYYAGSKRIPSWAVGISILATIISSVTFIAYPGNAYDKNWLNLVQGLMVPVVLLTVIWFIIPIYRESIGISAYEYFEHRFGYSSRLYASLVFTAMHFTKMGTVIYLLSQALAILLGVNPFMVIIVVGGATILYTLIGGIEAVIWTDVLQGFLFLSGGLICVGILLFKPPGGPSEVISYAWNHNKIDVGPYAFDFTRPTLIVLVINGIFYYLQKYSADQTMVQRYLVAKTDRGAFKATLLGGLLCVPTWTMFMFIGSCLYSFYRLSSNVLPPNQMLPAGTKAEQVFPFFIATQLPIGVTGLVLAALVAAAMSNLSSDMNCLSAVVVEDYFRRLRPDATDRQRLAAGKWAVAVCGCLVMGIAFFYLWLNQESILNTVFALYSAFSGGIVGLFALGFFSRRANKQGVLFGIFACILFTIWGLFTTQFKGARLLDLHQFNFPHDAYMLGVYSHIILFVVGYTASLFFPTHLESERFTLHGYLERRHAKRLQDALTPTTAK